MQCRKLSFLRRQESSIYGVLVPLESLDSRFRGNDGNGDLSWTAFDKEGQPEFRFGASLSKKLLISMGYYLKKRAF